MLRDVHYPGAAPGDRRRSLDLYLPADRSARPPLLVFADGGRTWLEEDRDAAGPALAAALVREGAAVALARYRLAPAARHPAAAEDLAAAVALLIAQAPRHGYDPGRVHLGGRGAGAHLAALVALDPGYLGRHGLRPADLAGVITINGIHDLTRPAALPDVVADAVEPAFGRDPAVLARVSPARLARADAPPFLILGAQGDADGRLPADKRFADALLRAGHRRAERWIVPARDAENLVRLDDPDNDARPVVLEWLGTGTVPPAARDLIEAHRRWQREPPFSTLPFWRHEKLVRAYPVDSRFVARMLPVFGASRFELLAWPLERFHAIPLLALLDALPADRVGRGRHIVLSNVRGELQFWTREQIAPWEPVVVIGLDDERNLFRLGTFYRARREYSWKPGPPPPLMARPLGAFVHFLKEPPGGLAVPQAAHYSLTLESFRLTDTDPLARFADLPPPVRDTITFRNGCVYCHAWRGSPARSHHVTAASGVPHGGFALPLESYPPDVWKAFVFDQEAAARRIGAVPNVVAEDARQALYEAVNRSRGGP